MNYLNKLVTALRLAATLDWKALRKRWFILRGERRLARHGPPPFVHKEMGFPSVCHPDWPESRDQFCNLLGYTRTAGDVWEFDLVRRWLRPGDSSIDAGTNLGLYTFAIADRVGIGGEVLSVDADPAIIARLSRAAALLSPAPIAPLHGAVSDRSGTLTFFVRTDGSTTADQSLIPEAALVAACTPVSVPAYHFPDLVAKLARPSALALIKMDIEGAEALALGTVPRELRDRNGPLWLIEINPGVLARFNATATEVIGFFPASDFELWIVPKHPLGNGTSAIRHYRATDPLTDSLYYNLIAVPLGARWAERRESLAAKRPDPA